MNDNNSSAHRTPANERERSFLNGAVAAMEWTATCGTGKAGADVEWWDESGRCDDAITSAITDGIAAWALGFCRNQSHLLDATGNADYHQHGHDFIMTATKQGVDYRDRGYPADVADAVVDAVDAWCADSELNSDTLANMITTDADGSNPVYHLTH